MEEVLQSLEASRWHPGEFGSQAAAYVLYWVMDILCIIYIYIYIYIIYDVLHMIYYILYIIYGTYYISYVIYITSYIMHHICPANFGGSLRGCGGAEPPTYS